MAFPMEFSESDIREQLGRILSSPSFRSSSILSSFLQFVVDETLAGRSNDLKEYTIAINALSRNNKFNPQLDAVVRIHAGRLRRALHEYHYQWGNADPIRIEIPKGSYVPQFQTPAEKESETNKSNLEISRLKPTVAVIPFRNISMDSTRDFFADGLGEQLSSELTHFQDLCVISYYSSRFVSGKTNDLTEAAHLLGAKYMLTGSVQSDSDQLRIWVQLILGVSGEQLWSRSFEKNRTATGFMEIQNEIVKSVLAAIGGYYGVIFRNTLQSPLRNYANSLEIYDAIFWYYYYQKTTSSETLEKAVNALTEAVKRDPDYALAWAMLSELYLGDKVHVFKTVENPAQEGLKFALRAVEIDPNCQHGYQALSWAYLFHQEREKCLTAVQRCLAVNPHASDRTGAMGFVLICAGEFEQGYELLNGSILQNPYFPWWFNTGFYFYFLHKKEYAEAWRWAEKINLPSLFWDPLQKAAVLGHLGQKVEASRQIELLKMLLPDTSIQAKNGIESFLLSSRLKNELLEGLRMAGLMVPEPSVVQHSLIKTVN